MSTTVEKFSRSLPPEEVELLEVVRDFVERRVRPVVRELEHENIYPAELIEEMKASGCSASRSRRRGVPGRCPRRATRSSPPNSPRDG